MKTPEEVAREALGNIAGPLRHIFGDAAWLDALDVLLAQEAEHLADLIRARDAEVRDALGTEEYEPCCRYCGEPGSDCPGPCC